MVMHGSSSVPQELQDIINENGGEMPQTWGTPVAEIIEGIKYGVRKVLLEKKAEFDPRKYTIPATSAMQVVCEARYESFGTAGNASKLKPLPLTVMAERYNSGELDQKIN